MDDLFERFREISGWRRPWPLIAFLPVRAAKKVDNDGSDCGDQEGRFVEKHPLQLTCEVELQPGEKLTLPARLVECVGPGRWIITVQPLRSLSAPVRRHDAFLHGYAPEDEGLYGDDPAR